MVSGMSEKVSIDQMRMQFANGDDVVLRLRTCQNSGTISVSPLNPYFPRPRLKFDSGNTFALTH